MIVKYKFKTKPYDHQIETLDRSINKDAYAFFMEMGAGESKCLIDTVSNLHLKGLIDFVLIIAPKGVFRNWTNKEIPEHFPEDVPHRVIRWHSGPNKGQLKEMRAVNEHFDGLTIFVMNVESFSTVKGKTAGVAMAKRLGRRGLIAVDESTTIKNHKAKRTKALCKIARGFKYRRILTGSPVTKAPMDLYSQVDFLGPNMLGVDSFYAFQGRYAIIRKQQMGAMSFNKVIGYRNLEELSAIIEPYSYRVLKEDCLDLPPKIHTSRTVDMTPEQAKMYEKIRNDAFLLLESGEIVTTQQAVTQMLRLQQVLSGHLMTDDGETITFPTKRMDALIDIAEETDGKMIIWSRFRHDMREIVARLNKEYGEGAAVSYYGSTTVEDRDKAVKDFQDPDSPVRFFVSNKTGAYGITLTEARTVVFYANDYDLEVRMQASDRPHRIGQKNVVTYIDLMTPDTIDEKIVDSLQNKINMSATVLGEKAKEWLAPKSAKERKTGPTKQA